MRLMRKDQRIVTFRVRVALQDADMTTYEGWGESAETIRGNVQPAGGKVMAEQYGERLAYMLVMYVEASQPLPVISESAGAWVNVPVDAAEPDYRVVAVRRWRHTVIELEAIS